MPPLPEVEGYSQLEPLARGGFGVIYRAHQDRFDRVVALKVLSVVDLTDRDRARFDRECRAMGKLSWHPNVVAVLDSGVTADGHPYLAMEFVPGGSLAERLKDGPMAWPDVVEAVVQVKVPVPFLTALPYVLTVFVLAGFVGKAIPPRAGGEPYVKER